MKNPIVEEKIRLQKKLSERSGSVAAYTKMARMNAQDIEKRLKIKFKRPSSVSS